MSAWRLGKCHGKRPCAFPALALPPVPAEDAERGRGCCGHSPAPGAALRLPTLLRAAGACRRQRGSTCLLPGAGTSERVSCRQQLGAASCHGPRTQIPARGTGCRGQLGAGGGPGIAPKCRAPKREGFWQLLPGEAAERPQGASQGTMSVAPSAHREKDFVPIDQIFHSVSDKGTGQLETAMLPKGGGCQSCFFLS